MDAEAYVREGDLVLHCDLPGVGLEEVDITLDANVLTVSGERKLPSEKDISYYLEELPSGAFRRSVTVPAGVEAEAIKVHMENGTLEVVLPGAVGQFEPTKIAIKGGETQSMEGATS